MNKEFLKTKLKSVGLITLSILGSLAGKILADKFEKQTNISNNQVTINNYVINSLPISTIIRLIENELSDNKVEINDGDDIGNVSELDLAYDFLTKNVRLNDNEHVNICFQKGKESIIVSYIFDEELTSELHSEGLSRSSLFSFAESLEMLDLQLSEYLQDSLGFTVPIEIKVYTNDGELLIHIKDNQLMVLESIRPRLTAQEI